jgi:hypothetical protein
VTSKIGAAGEECPQTRGAALGVEVASPKLKKKQAQSIMSLKCYAFKEGQSAPLWKDKSSFLSPLVRFKLGK